MANQRLKKHFLVTIFLSCGFIYPNNVKAQLDQQYKQQINKANASQSNCNSLYNGTNILAAKTGFLGAFQSVAEEMGTRDASQRFDPREKIAIDASNKVWSTIYQSNGNALCSYMGVLNHTISNGQSGSLIMIKWEGRELIRYVKDQNGQLGRETIGILP